MPKADSKLVAAALAQAPNAAELFGGADGVASAAPLTMDEVTETINGTMPDFTAPEEAEDAEGDDYEPNAEDDADLGATAVVDVVADANSRDNATPAPTYSAEQIAELRQQADTARWIQQNPQAYIAWLQQNNPQALQAMQPVAQEPDRYVIPQADMDTLTVAERLAYDNKEFITQGPKRAAAMQQQLEQTRQEMNGAFTWRDYQIERQQVVIDALAEVLGIAVPEPDQAHIETLMRNKPLRDAVRESYGTKVKAAVALKQAQNKPTPRTPSSTGGDTVPIHPSKLPASATLKQQMVAEAKYKAYFSSGRKVVG